MKIQATNIEKSFGNNKVLHSASINIEPGTVHAFMGENGAGKSTLMNIIIGDLTFDGGKIMIDGEDVKPYQNPNKKISFIRQELNLVSELTVYENMYLGKMSGFVVNDNKLINEATNILKRLGLDLDPRKKVKELSIGEQQMVEIAKGLIDDCEVLIMDEPTAALTDKEIAKLFEIVNDLKNQGVAIVYISHRMKEIFEISDVITVMRDGVYIEQFKTSEVDEDQLINSMVGREIEFKQDQKTFEFGQTILEVENITSKENKFNDISFTVREGEIVALAGLMGAKRTEILEAIANVTKIDSGQILYFGQPIHNTNIRQTIDKGIAFITEDRKQTGLFLDFDIKTNIGIPNATHVSNHGVINRAKEEKLSEYFGKKLGIKYDNLNQKVSDLSGGNQQKVVISKWLASMPKLLILDEPTRGIDVNAKREIYKLIKEQAKNNMGIILVSSEMTETLLLADTIVTLNEGRQTNTLTNQDLTEERLLDLMIGGNNEK